MASTAQSQRNRLQKRLLSSGLPTIQCRICELHFRQLECHLMRIHNISVREYSLKYLKLGEKITAPDILRRKKDIAISNNSARYILDPEVMARSREAVLSAPILAKIRESRRGRPKLHKKSETALQRGTKVERKCPKCGATFIVWRSTKQKYCSSLHAW